MLKNLSQFLLLVILTMPVIGYNIIPEKTSQILPETNFFDEFSNDKQLNITLAKDYEYTKVIKVDFNAKENNFFTITLKSDNPSIVGISCYFTTDNSKELSDDKSFSFKLPVSNQAITYSLNLDNITTWQNNITGMRLDFSGVPNQKLSVEYLSLGNVLEEGKIPEVLTILPYIVSPAGLIYLNSGKSFSNIKVVNGILQLTMGGDYSYTGAFPLLIQAKSYKFLKIRYKSSSVSNHRIGFYFSKKGNLSLTDAESAYIEKAVGDNYSVAAFDLSKYPHWQGLITGMRLDFSGAPNQIFEISDIYFTNSENILQNEKPVKLSNSESFQSENIYALLQGKVYNLMLDYKLSGSVIGKINFYDDNKELCRVDKLVIEPDKSKFQHLFYIPENATKTSIELAHQGQGTIEINQMILQQTNQSAGNWQASWIAHPDEVRKKGASYFATNFELKKKPTDARLQFTADDRIYWYINGTLFFNKRNLWQHPEIVDVTNYLKAGNNEIKAKLINHGDWGGLLAELVAYMPNGEKITKNSDSSWLTSNIEQSDFANQKLTNAVKPLELGIPPISPWGGIPYQKLNNRPTFLLDSCKISEISSKNDCLIVNLNMKTKYLANQELDNMPIVIAYENYPLTRVAYQLPKKINKIGEQIRIENLSIPLKTDKMPRGEYWVIVDNDLFKIDNAPQGIVAKFELNEQTKNCESNAIAKVVKEGCRNNVYVNDKNIYLNSYVGAFIDQRRFASQFFGQGVDSVIIGDGYYGRGCFNRAWVGVDKYDFSAATKEIERYISINPNVKIILGIGVDAPEWWAKQNPDELIKFGDKTTPELLSSPASLKLREDVSRTLKTNLEHWENSKFAPNIIGYRIMSQIDGGEFQLLGGWDGKHADYSPAMQNYFRNFLREKYGSDENLQKAWNKNDAALATAKIPTPDERKNTEIFIFRDFSKSKNVADYEDCLNYMMADWAMYLGKIARNIIPKKLLGIYGGYVPGIKGFQLMNNGHLQFGKIYDSNLFDFFCSPHDYGLRQVGMPGGNHAPVGSVNLRKQFFWTENDTRTFLCAGDNWSHVKNLHESIGVLKRDFAANLISNSPMYFLDMNGGWFANPGILEIIGDFQKIGNASLEFPDNHRPEVAILYDTDSIYHINENSAPVTQMASLQLRQNLAFAGVDFDQYLLEDIARDNFPAYKCYIIVNAFAPSKLVRKSVKDKLQKNNSIVVWAYGSGFFDENDKLSVESIRELTGIEYAIEQKEQALMLKTNKNELVGTSVIPVGPFAYIVDKNVEVLGNFKDTNKVALAVKKLNDSIAVAAPVISLSPELWHNIFKQYGVRLFTDSGDPVMYNGRFLGIHARNDGEKKVVIPQKTNIYDAFTGKLIAEDTDTIEINMPRGKTELFFLGNAGDINKYRKLIKK
jgi:hypothetical protein